VPRAQQLLPNLKAKQALHLLLSPTATLPLRLVLFPVHRHHLLALKVLLQDKRLHLLVPRVPSHHNRLHLLALKVPSHHNRLHLLALLRQEMCPPPSQTQALRQRQVLNPTQTSPDKQARLQARPHQLAPGVVTVQVLPPQDLLPAFSQTAGLLPKQALSQMFQVKLVLSQVSPVVLQV